MPLPILSVDALRRALAVRDLADPAQGPHAMQLIVEAIVAALTERWRCRTILHRQSPIVSIADNYDRLRYPPDGPARDARYTRYVCDSALLRTQTSAMIPPLLARLAGEDEQDALLVCPGLAYRRDCIDRLHTGEPQQLDLWRIARGQRLGDGDLREMIALVIAAALPGREWRALPTAHPYTVSGLQIDVREADGWIEVGECGLALPGLLRDQGLPDSASGLAMGLGLDRLLMLRKGIDDIRLLRSEDPRVAAQLLDLAPYRPVSSMPATTRDLSLVLDGDGDAEELGDAVRTALGERADLVESLGVVSETPYTALPPAAIARLGIAPGQKNALLRITLRALDRSIGAEEGNRLRDEIYAALHRGTTWHWAARPQ
jgi:phenylalanyl-tRNA synthetase alpha chain